MAGRKMRLNCIIHGKSRLQNYFGLTCQDLEGVEPFNEKKLWVSLSMRARKNSQK
jgi:hypothetical protein